MNSTDEEQLTKSVTHFLNESVLKGARSFQIRDIERCHVVGKAKGGRPKQIIIKFAHYQDKRRVFAAKSSLKGHPSKIFITEDLTSYNHSMVKQLLSLKRGNKIDSFWTSDGRVLVKKDAVSDPIYVSPRVSIFEKLGVKIVADELAGVEPAEPMSLENLNLPVNRLMLMIYSPTFLSQRVLILLKLS